MQYKIVKRGQPGVSGGGDIKYYATPHYTGKTDLADISRRVSDGSTLTETDVVAVLTRVVNTIGEQLKEGKIVQLGNLGSFRISISSQGETSADEVSALSIRNSKVLFRPSAVFNTRLADLRFEKARDVVVNPDNHNNLDSAA